ncbi:DUF1961 family protein [Aquibacillus rhizosphaerae]|uniref:DUF1961 family protein n=1 Tax=Aquibacillus rhizosphaerae TaxID=3051431 RepID=A0ABT7LCI8_9BACI|nr:DUF1961 family protein [Aquibacillus sp. LR5S19]MDL4842305.1 DUF1961 family protein [Aquibacillus sp. LR5S19]
MFEAVETLYENPMGCMEDIEHWRLEGSAKIDCMDDRIILQNKLDPDLFGDDAHWVFGCPEEFPDRIIIEWDFYPMEEPGLCMIFMAASGQGGKDLFDESLPNRTGKYPEYHSGSIDALHLSYFRHKHIDERAFRTCNLRKSCGFHLVSQAAEPLPPVEDARPPYHMKLIKYEGIVQFTINQLPILEWIDDGLTYGPILRGGKIGFRQMAPMKAAYRNLIVRKALLKK